MKIPENHWLLTRPIAHRGLWGGEILENSLTAYKNAAEKGYPIEIDLHLSTDGVLYSFHDDNTLRMTGVDKNIHDLSSKEIDELRLLGSDEHIPTFEEVLSIAENKVPLLIEIKNQPNKQVVDKTVERLKTYKGEFAVQSFNPLYINRVKKLAPEFIRGILATEKSSKQKLLNRIVITKMPLNFLIKPDFISFSHTGLPLKKRKVKNIPVITWTITDQESADRIKPYAKNIIFEKFIPKW
ncbi:MAG: hypothetical protein E7375_03125 [Clostridiales bacterium]|nr:hypothetical protein [Clostridiales bacterium]